MSGAVPAASLAHEIASADLILVTAVTRVSDTSEPVALVSPEARPDDDLLRVAEMTVVRTLTGEHHGGPLRVFFLVGKVPSRPWMALTEGQTVLLFLRSADDSYAPVEPWGIPIQTLPGIAPPPAGVSRTRAVVHELEQVILTADPISSASLIVRATIARVGLRGDVDLDLLSTPVLQDPTRRAAWVAIVLAEGKVEALDEVPSLFANRAPPPADTLWDLIVQKVSELRVAEAHSQLVALLQTERIELARAAAVALRQLRDPAVVLDLIGALDHQDLEVRYQALMALAELEPSVGAGPSFELYRQNESYYIHQWKQWHERRDKL